ncbi:MAG: hypothetical protein JKY67_21900 [Pseudomonadales bacterium]|nr:hypothetical protein [Pseudomonadales bacterium]
MAEMLTTEEDILNTAIQMLEREAGLRLEINPLKAKLKNTTADAILNIAGQKKKIAVKIKKWAPQLNLGALIHMIQQLPQPGMLVADHVNPNMADKLRERNMQFIDTAGNAYINLAPVYVFVKGNRALATVEKREQNNRVFETMGLKVIYAFLCDDNLVAAAYRTIAEQAGVALGTVGWVINGLQDAGFIVAKAGKKNRRLINRKKLLDQWVELYPRKLRPKHHVGNFIANDPNWWKTFNPIPYHAHWGGEVAAAKYTKYLKPEVTTLYIPPDTTNKLLAKAKLKKAVDQPANVKIYRPIGIEANKIKPDLVHPILVYADLIATADIRNLETAEKLYEDYIAEYFRED